MDDLEYTQVAWESLYDVVDNSKFSTHEAKMIYSALVKKCRLISFGDYLKRYIYLKTEMEQPFSSVTIQDYQMIIKEAFMENHTPASFKPTTAKLSALSKNWLTQQSVKRNVVFLLGFGLRMSMQDVNDFLTKGICEPRINPKNPFEAICGYCYQNGYNFHKFETLWEMYQNNDTLMMDIESILSNHTIGLQNSLLTIHDDIALMSYLQTFRTSDNMTFMSKSAKIYFERLYNESKILIANMYNESADNNRFVKSEDISESDFEHVICSAIPINRQGNLAAGRVSTLNEQFQGKRFSRQRIGEINAGKKEVNRFDLITLNFFIFSQKLDQYSNAEKRYSDFLDSTNEILNKCLMDKVYVQNPYECFVLMCILSDDPLSTYADVLEMSFDQD